MCRKNMDIYQISYKASASQQYLVTTKNPVIKVMWYNVNSTM